MINETCNGFMENIQNIENAFNLRFFSINLYYQNLFCNSILLNMN